jgi:hypothetical protein
VSTAISGALDLGMWAYGATDDDRPGDDEVRFAADALGANIVDRATIAVATFRHLGDVIVSDPSKLELMGRWAGCSEADPDCPAKLSFSETDQEHAYLKLLPLSYRIFILSRRAANGAYAGPTPPNIVYYQCKAPYPWRDYDAGPFQAYTAWLQDLDPSGAQHGWDTFTIGLPPSKTTQHATPPPEALRRTLYPSVASGGLGLPLDRLVRELGQQYYWMGSSEEEAAHCAF